MTDRRKIFQGWLILPMIYLFINSGLIAPAVFASSLYVNPANILNRKSPDRFDVSIENIKQGCSGDGCTDWGTAMWGPYQTPPSQPGSSWGTTGGSDGIAGACYRITGGFPQCVANQYWGLGSYTPANSNMDGNGYEAKNSALDYNASYAKNNNNQICWYDQCGGNCCSNDANPSCWPPVPGPDCWNCGYRNAATINKSTVEPGESIAFDFTFDQSKSPPNGYHIPDDYHYPRLYDTTGDPDGGTIVHYNGGDVIHYDAFGTSKFFRTDPAVNNTTNLNLLNNCVRSTINEVYRKGYRYTCMAPLNQGAHTAVFGNQENCEFTVNYDVKIVPMCNTFAYSVPPPLQLKVNLYQVNTEGADPTTGIPYSAPGGIVVYYYSKTDITFKTLIPSMSGTTQTVVLPPNDVSATNTDFRFNFLSPYEDKFTSYKTVNDALAANSGTVTPSDYQLTTNINLTQTATGVNTANIGIKHYPRGWFQAVNGDGHAEGVINQVITPNDKYSILNYGVLSSRSNPIAPSLFSRVPTPAAGSVGEIANYNQPPDQFTKYKYDYFLKKDPPDQTAIDCTMTLAIGNGVFKCVQSGAFPNDLTWPGFNYAMPMNKNTVLFIPGNLTIDGNITGNAQSGLILIVKGDVKIKSTVNLIEAVIIYEGKIDDAYDVSLTAASLLNIKGGLIGAGADPNMTYGGLRRVLADKTVPSEVFEIEPKYYVNFTKLLGESKTVWEEVAKSDIPMYQPTPTPIIFPTATPVPTNTPMPTSTPTPTNTPTSTPTPTPTLILGSELVINGGFESGMTAWDSPAIYNANTTVINGYDKALYVSAYTDGVTTNYIRKTQWITASPNTQYYIGGDAKVDSLGITSGRGVTIKVDEYNNSTFIAQHILNFTNTAIFEPKTAIFTSSANTNQIAFSMFVYDQAKAWYDDLFIANSAWVNLLQNSDFQLALPTGWVDPTWADSAVSIQNTLQANNSGSNGMKIIYNANNCAKVQKTQWINVTPGIFNYEFSAYGKLVRNNGSGVNVMAEEYTSSNGYNGGYTLNFTSPNYEKKSLRITTQATTSKIAVSMFVYDCSIGYIDDISLRKGL